MHSYTLQQAVLYYILQRIQIPLNQIIIMETDFRTVGECVKCKRPLLIQEAISYIEYTICRKCHYEEERKKLTEKHVYFEPPDLIKENLWLGSCYSDVDEGYLKALGISAVVLACYEGTERFPKSLRYCKMELEDNYDADLLNGLIPAYEFIKEHLLKRQGVLVRCAAGVSRSASVVIAYLMKEEKLRYKEAVDVVKRARPIISPNTHFVKQLQSYEQMLGIVQIRKILITNQRVLS
eukprot:TRINITY_DN547_c0_g1_i1.p1 TRINITY_DN547_c0_g1~~TRINITY_DN547_c0_g1_i1.p1  ORF type:complete len:248 (+),score=5.63 TRINITY_DN547_c0_g1_i1:34-744(+)